MSKAVFRFYDNEEEISEDFKLYIMKQRERIFQKTSVVLQTNEKNYELKYYAFQSQAFLSRIDPPMTEEYYFNHWQEMLQLIPTSFHENYAYYMGPLGEMTHTILLQREFASSDSDAKEISFWNTFYQILILVKEFLLEINEESYKIE